MCVSFFIGFKVSCDTLNTFEKKREVFFLRCHVVCVFIFFIGGVLVLEKRHSRLIDDGFVVVLYTTTKEEEDEDDDDDEEPRGGGGGAVIQRGRKEGRIEKLSLSLSLSLF